MTLILAYPFGMFGADRFYLGKTRSAVLKLVTFGGFGVWMLIDLILTLSGHQRDVWGLRLAGYDKHKRTVWIIIGAFFGFAILINAISAMARAAYDSNGPTAFGWAVLGIIAVAAAAMSAIWFVRHRRVRGTPANAARKDDPVPPRIRARIDKLTTLRPVYVLHAAAGNRAAADLVGQVDSLLAHVTELFRRLGKANEAQRGRAQDEYDAKLHKLVAALDHDYLLDVLSNPRLWDDPGQRIRGVQAAIQALDGQLLDNIRQVNARQGLVFEVALDEIGRLR